MDIKQKWSDLINRVEHAGDQQHKMIKYQQKHRMQVLRHQLLNQINQKKQAEIQRNITKHKQREEIQQLIKQQKLKQIQQKEKKKQLEHDYYLSNQALLYTPKKVQQIDIGPSPSDKLIQNSTKRQMALKDKFKQHSQINLIQIEVNKQKKRSKQKQQKVQSNKFINYVEEQYIRRQTERQKFKQKYLKNDIPYSIPQQGLQKQRITLKKFYQQKEQELDPDMEKFNSKVQNSFNSPAYLGKNALAFDRKVQLDFLDKQLGIKGQYYPNKIRIHSQERQYQKNQNRHQRFPSLTRNNNRINTESPESYSINQSNIRSALNAYEKNDIKGEKQLNLKIEQIQTSRRSYFQYNILTGGKSQFFT